MRPLLLPIVTVCLAAPALRAQELEVHVINVDQGLSVYVESPTGKRLLIDGGNPGDGTAIVIPYLQSIGTTGLDYSVMTHWHTDHFGGLTNIHASSYKPLVAAYDRGDTNRPSNGFVTSYLNAVSGKRAIPTQGQVLDLGGGCTLTFVSRDGVHPTGTVNVSGEENAHSLGMVLRYGDFDLYVAGDLTSGGLSTPNVEGPVTAWIGQVEVAISSHHGSPSSSSSTVVGNLNPSLVVHSAGHDNPYGHPSETVVNNWSTSAATRVQWCTTDGETASVTLGGDPGGFNALSSHVVITSNGSSFRARSPAHPESVDFATFELPGTYAGSNQIAINEVLVDPLAFADAEAEWIELVNFSASTLNLGGLELSNGTQSFRIASQIVLDAGERFVVGLDGRPARNGDFFLGVGAPWRQFSLPNASGALTLKSASGTTLETFTWGAGGVAIAPGVSAERIAPASPALPNNFAACTTSWSSGDRGTPWLQNVNGIGTCPPPLAYGTGKLTSNGTLPTVTWTGTPSVDTNDFSITLQNALPQKSTILFYGFARDQKPFAGGTLWCKTPVKRMGVSVTSLAGNVTYPIAIDASMAGTRRCYQFWFRDPFVADGSNVGLSSALDVQFCPLPGPPAPGNIVITEVMKDPAFVADSSGEWIEVYNASPSVVNLEGWVLRDNGTESITLANGGNGIYVPAGRYLVLGANGDPLTNGGIAVGYDWDWTLFKLDNADDEIVLVAPGNVEIDRIEYDNGFLWPDSAGLALSLRAGVLSASGNDSGNAWCSASPVISATNSDHGTPGVANDSCP